MGYVKNFIKTRSHMDIHERSSIDTADARQVIAQLKAPTAHAHIEHGKIADQESRRAEKRRRKTGSSVSAMPILLGFWKKSPEPDDMNKHAVYGTIQRNGSLRVTIWPKTRDGRPLQSRLPSGSGSGRLSFGNYQVEDSLKSLNKAQIKQYCLIRQSQMDYGEQPGDISDHIQEAVQQALSNKPVPLAQGISRSELDRQYSSHGVPELEPSTQETSQSNTCSTPYSVMPDRAQYSIQFRPANRSKGGESGRINLATNTVSSTEYGQTGSSQYVTSHSVRNASGEDSDGVPPSHCNILHLGRETRSMDANKEDFKECEGTRYDRRENGSFAGSLVSRGTLTSVDGEDYVQYCILAKVTV